MTNFLAVITAYCACVKCCGTNADGINAAGRAPVQGISIAGPRRFPLGTKVKLEGMTNVFVIDDRLARKYDVRFDIFFNSHADALRFGKRSLRVTVITNK